MLEISNLEKVKDTYFLLAKALGQQHVPVIGGKGDRNEWFRVDPALVETALAKLHGELPSLEKGGSDREAIRGGINYRSPSDPHPARSRAPTSPF